MSRGPAQVEEKVEKPASNMESSPPEKSGVRATSVLGSTRLRFERSPYHCLLTIEAPARDQLLPELYHLLLAAGVQVIRVHSQVLGDRTLHELAAVDRDGNPIDEERWRDVQVVIFEHLGDRVAAVGPELRFTRGRSRPLRHVAE